MSGARLTGRISHFFTVNRPLSILILIVLLAFGLLSFFLTPKQYNPDIVRPAFFVTVQYEGATTQAAIDRVVYEMVEKIQTVPGVDDINTEVRDGASIKTTVIFEVGYDAVKAKLDLLSHLEQHAYLARGNIQSPQILEINPETIPVLQIALGSDALSIAELREQVLSLSHKLTSVPDVSEVSVYGGYAPALVVEVSPELLSANGISLSLLQATLTESQERLVTRGVRASPHTIDIVFDGTVSTPEAIGSLRIADDVRVRDVARVFEGPNGPRSYILYQDDITQGEIVMLSMAKVEGSSAPVVTKDFLEAMETQLARPEFSQLTYTIVSNDGATAEAEIYGLTKNLLTSIGIVALVLVLFLSTRAALVVMVAIPVTFLVVFGLGYIFDQTINRITLFALILSLGLLVDSAIVATENIYAHLKRWQKEPSAKTKEQVIATAIDEIGVGLLLSTITSIIVFLPMNFITGMMGPYMGPISFFVPAALVVSFLVAIVITPFVASYVLDTEKRNNRITEAFSRLMRTGTMMYSSLLRSILERPTRQKIVLRSALVLFIISLVLPLTGLVHFQMLPRADRDQVYVFVDLPVGTDREATKEITQTISNVLTNHEQVIHVQQFIATAPILDFNGMFKGAQLRDAPEHATLRVNFTPAPTRRDSSTTITSALRAHVASELPHLAETIRFMEEPPGPPVQATLVGKVSAADAAIQREAAITLQDFFAAVSGVVDTHVSDEEPVGRVVYQFDHEVAATYGVSAQQVSEALSLLDGSYEVRELLAGTHNEYTPIVLTFPSSLTQDPNSIDSIRVQGSGGEFIPLRAVLQTTYEVRPSVVHFERAEPLSYVTAEVEDRSIVYVVIEIMYQLIQGELAGYTVDTWGLFGMELVHPEGEKISLAWGGEWEMTLENFRDLGIAMAVALLLVYALLVAQYRRFSTPAYILVTVPLGLVGIVWGFFLLDVGFGIYLTATALIGFIALIGIVVNNAIIYLEYVEHRRSEGVSYHEALITAGEARLRPILLTSLTTLLGSLTIASDPVWSGLAWAIVFGLSLSTILTLIIYPTLLARFVANQEA